MKTLDSARECARARAVMPVLDRTQDACHNNRQHICTTSFGGCPSCRRPSNRSSRYSGSFGSVWVTQSGVAIMALDSSGHGRSGSLLQAAAYPPTAVPGAQCGLEPRIVGAAKTGPQAAGSRQARERGLHPDDIPRRPYRRLGRPTARRLRDQEGVQIGPPPREIARPIEPRSRSSVGQGSRPLRYLPAPPLSSLRLRSLL
jgi:hypothetical protein